MEIKGNTLYDANKQLVLEHEHPLNHLEMASKQEALQEWFDNEVIFWPSSSIVVILIKIYK